MNPCIVGYDKAPLTIPLLLIAWRSLCGLQKLVERWKAGRASGSFNSAAASNQLQSPRLDRKTLAPILVGVSGFAACNILDGIWGDWLPMELTVLLGVFALGLWTLLRPAGSFFQQKPSPEMP